MLTCTRIRTHAHAYKPTGKKEYIKISPFIEQGVGELSHKMCSGGEKTTGRPTEIVDHKHFLCVVVCTVLLINVGFSHFRDLLAKFPGDLFQFCQEDINTLCHALGNCLQCACLRIKQVIIIM